MTNDKLTQIAADLNRIIKEEEEEAKILYKQYAPAECYARLLHHINEKADALAKEHGYNNALSIITDIEARTSQKFVNFSDFGRFAIRYQTHRI